MRLSLSLSLCLSVHFLLFSLSVTDICPPPPPLLPLLLQTAAPPASSELEREAEMLKKQLVFMKAEYDE